MRVALSAYLYLFQNVTFFIADKWELYTFKPRLGIFYFESFMLLILLDIVWCNS